MSEEINKYSFESIQDVPNTCGIYFIFCTENEKFYIGSSNDFNRRATEHKNDLIGNKHNNDYLQNCFNKYGIQSHQFWVLQNATEEKQFDVEQSWLDVYYCHELCMNLSPYADRPFNYNPPQRCYEYCPYTLKLLNEYNSLTEAGIQESYSKYERNELNHINESLWYCDIPDMNELIQRQKIYVELYPLINVYNYLYEFVGSFTSKQIYKQFTGIKRNNLYSILCGESRTAKGLTFSLTDLSFLELVEKFSKAQSVIRLTDKKVYTTASYAAKDNNSSSSRIGEVCRGKIKSSMGHKWMYYSDYLIEKTET